MTVRHGCDLKVTRVSKSSFKSFVLHVANSYSSSEVRLYSSIENHLCVLIYFNVSTCVVHSPETFLSLSLYFRLLLRWYGWETEIFFVTLSLKRSCTTTLVFFGLKFPKIVSCFISWKDSSHPAAEKQITATGQNEHQVTVSFDHVTSL